MTRSRFVVVSSASVAAVGVIVALGASALNPARAAVGPLPGEALALPADAKFLAGLDVKRFTASPFYARYGKGPRSMRPEAFKELEEKTGLVPERDLDRVVIAGGSGGRESGVVLVLGEFDEYKLARTLETEKKGVTWEKHEGTTVYLSGEGAQDSAFAILSRNTLVLGSRAAVLETVASHAAGRTPLRSNRTLVELLGRVKPGATFWMVGDQSLLQHMPKALPAPGAAGSTLALPALKSLVIAGDLDPVVALSVTGDASDEAAAKNLADVVRGFLAIAQLQAGQKPELRELATAVSVTTNASQVMLSARFPYELLDALTAPKAAATPPAPGAVR